MCHTHGTLAHPKTPKTCPKHAKGKGTKCVCAKNYVLKEGKCVKNKR